MKLSPINNIFRLCLGSAMLIKVLCMPAPSPGGQPASPPAAELPARADSQAEGAQAVKTGDTKPSPSAEELKATNLIDEIGNSLIKSTSLLDYSLAFLSSPSNNGSEVKIVADSVPTLTQSVLDLRKALGGAEDPEIKQAQKNIVIVSNKLKESAGKLAYAKGEDAKLLSDSLQKILKSSNELIDSARVKVSEETKELVKSLEEQVSKDTANLI